VGSPGHREAIVARPPRTVLVQPGTQAVRGARRRHSADIDQRSARARPGSASVVMRVRLGVRHACDEEHAENYQRRTCGNRLVGSMNPGLVSMMIRSGTSNAIPNASMIVMNERQVQVDLDVFPHPGRRQPQQVLHRRPRDSDASNVCAQEQKKNGGGNGRCPEIRPPASARE